MSDAVLITQKNGVQDVKKVLDLLKLKNIKPAESHPKDFRAWGCLKVLSLMITFRSKVIFLSQEQRLAFKDINIVLNIG